MVDAIARPTDEPFPASVILDGEYGVTGISSSSPVILGAQGLVKVIEILLTSDESTQFIDAAEKIEELSRKL
jgi:malate/lactate dehydrogenase